MRHNNSRFGNRRQTSKIPVVPFKDSNGATVWACRRKKYDRRKVNVQSGQIIEAVIR